jgi:hypothetical protein
MTLPFPLPDWLPWWVPLVLLVPALLYVLAFLFMPFSVIGVKGRLDVLEARLDEIQNEIRHLALRLPDAGQPVDYEEIFNPEPAMEERRRPPVVNRPPIPPAAHDPDRGGAAVDRPAPPAQARPSRREPKLDWPR